MLFRKYWAGWTALALTAVMFFAAGALAQDAQSAPPALALAEGGATAADLDSPFKAVYEQVSPSVVGIEITLKTDVFQGRILTTTSFVGSGVVIDEAGYVLTNYHVVEGADGIYVISGEEKYPAEYVAGDATSDVAVLRVEDARLTAAVLGDSDALSVGDWALVIGNPLGQQFANTLTVGVISGLGRDMADSVQGGVGSGSTDMIQTNAAINSGNSGGGLFNIAGELVGVTSMKLSNNGYFGYAAIEGIGFAIPINSVKTIASDLVAYGRVLYPRIGLEMVELNSPSMEPTEDMLPCSVWVRSVEAGGPAEAAGIRADDLILEVDGERVTTSAQVQSAIRAHEIGDTVSVTVYRIPNLLSIRADEKIPEGEYLTFEVEVKILDAD